MRLNLIQKFQDKLRQKIALRLQEKMERFEQVELKSKENIYSQVEKIQRRFATLDIKVETFSQPFIIFFFSPILLLIAVAPFYLAYRFEIPNPIKTALIYFVPYLIASILIYTMASNGNLSRSETNLPMTDKISNASRWIFISALISGISTFLFSPLAIYLILTPLIVGVGSAILFLSFEIIVKFILNKFVFDRYYKKYPASTISHMFIEVLGYFDVNLRDSRVYKMELAQLLGVTGEIMQRILPPAFSRIDRSFLVFEITDPYINKLIELKVAEMAMTLRVLAKMVLLDGNSAIDYVQSKIENNLIAILNDDWNKYEFENSDEIIALTKLSPLSTKTDKIFGKLKIVFSGLLPVGLLFLLQSTNYAIPDNIVENVQPFVVTLALVSILNAIGSDDIVDRMLKAKSVMSSFSSR